MKPFVSLPATRRPTWTLGLVHGKLGSPQKALDSFGEAIQLDPGHPVAYIYRGIAYENLGQYEEAVLDYGEALKLDPQNGPLYASRAVAYMLLGRDTEANQDAARALELGIDRDRLAEAIDAAKAQR